MKSMKYKIGPFELNNYENSQLDEGKIIPTKSPICSKKDQQLNNHIVRKKNFFYNQENDPSVEMHINYDADIDELNEIVICDPLKASSSSACVNKKRSSTKSNTSLSTTSSIDQVKISKEEIRVNNNSPITDSVSSSESGFGTTGDEENDNISNTYKQQSPTTSNSTNMQAISTLPINHCQPLPQEQRNNQGLISQQQALDSNELKISNSLPVILPPSRQIIFSGLANSSNKNNSEDVVNILNDNSSLNSSFYSMNSNNNRVFRCCSSIFNYLIKFYYSCFCCYSTTSHTNHTPLIWSWLSIFCCCCPVLGGLSLFLTHRSKMYKRKQKYDLADKYSNYAEKLNIASLIFGVIFYAIAFFLITLVIFMYWRPHNS